MRCRFLVSAMLIATLVLHVAAEQPGDTSGEEGPTKEGTCAGESCFGNDAENTNGKESNEQADEPPFVCDFVESLDFYERLGVPKDADERAIKKAYRKLSLTHHPDKVKGKPEQKECSQNHFIAITKAYETLRYVALYLS